MTKTTAPIAETWLCIDCTSAHESGESYPLHNDPIPDITANWGATEENNEDEEDGHHYFSRSACGICETTLGGDRYRYAVWAW
jgi:hypothetical protein